MSVLPDMDASLGSLAAALGDDRREVIASTGCYPNLPRQWAGG